MALFSAAEKQCPFSLSPSPRFFLSSPWPLTAASVTAMAGVLQSAGNTRMRKGDCSGDSSNGLRPQCLHHHHLGPANQIKIIQETPYFLRQDNKDLFKKWRIKNQQQQLICLDTRVSIHANLDNSAASNSGQREYHFLYIMSARVSSPLLLSNVTTAGWMATWCHHSR